MLHKFNLNPSLDMETMIWSNSGEVWLDDSTILLFKGDPTAQSTHDADAGSVWKAVCDHDLSDESDDPAD